MLDITEYQAGTREEIRGGEVVTIHAASMEALTKEERELAITGLIERASNEIQCAVDMGESADVMAAYKDQAAAIADLSKRLDVSKDAVLNAQVLQRRAERGLGLAIRAGQDAGQIETVEEARVRSGLARQHGDAITSVKPRVRDYLSKSEIAGPPVKGESYRAGILSLADAGTQADFDEALADAVDEKNVSRSNVVRKLKAARENSIDWESIAEKASEFNSSTEAHAELAPEGISLNNFRVRMNSAGVKFDTRAHKAAIAKSNDILDRVSLAIEVNAQAVDHITVGHITKEQAAEALERLTTALPILNKLRRELKKGN